MKPTQDKEPSLTIHVCIATVLLLLGVALWQKQFLLTLPERARNSWATLTQKQELSGHAHYSISDSPGIKTPSQSASTNHLKQSVHYEPAKNSCWQKCMSSNAKNCTETTSTMKKCIETAIATIDRQRKARGHSVPTR
jgi:hypothetical protein